MRRTIRQNDSHAAAWLSKRRWRLCPGRYRTLTGRRQSAAGPWRSPIRIHLHELTALPHLEKSRSGNGILTQKRVEILVSRRAATAPEGPQIPGKTEKTSGHYPDSILFRQAGASLTIVGNLDDLL